MQTEKVILDKLNEIKLELDFIKKHMVDVDTILTDDDVQALNGAEQDFKKGKKVKI